jgi:hypothetical protein
MRQIEDRFRCKTRESDIPHPTLGTKCLEWTARIGTWGYGEFWLNSLMGMQKAHRVAWWLHYSKWPTLLILHHCDNPKCVRPDHLFEGTNADNVADMMAKGRNRFVSGDQHWSRLHPERRPYGAKNGMSTHPGIKQGERNGRALVTASDVLRIRSMKAGRMTDRKIASIFGVSRQTINHICARKTWAHVVEAQ